MEIPYDKKRELIDQINDQGQYGYRFHSMAQKITEKKLSMTGQPEIDLVIIFEKQSFSSAEIPTAKA